MHRFKEDSALGQFLKLDCSKAHCADYLLRVLQAVVSLRCTHDPTNAAIIRCSVNLASAIGRSSFHIDDLRPLLMSHLIRLREPFNSSQSDGVIVSSRKADTSNTNLFTLKGNFHRLLKQTPGTDQQKEYYLFREVIELTHNYLRASPLFTDPRNPHVAVLGDDPMAAILGTRTIHRCQVPRLVQSHLQATGFKAGSIPPPIPRPQPSPATRAPITQEETPTRPPTLPSPPPPPPEPTTLSASATQTIRLGVKRKAQSLPKDSEPAPRPSSPEDLGRGGDRDTDPEC
jgi:hypothetical protein